MPAGGPNDPARTADDLGSADGLLVYTGEPEPLSPQSGKASAIAGQKWALQEVARQLLPEFKSLQKCHRTPRGRVEIHRSPSRESAAYRNLCTCQSLTACSVCSARISATRAAELVGAIDGYRDRGGTVLLATFTNAHTRSDSLSDLLTGQKSAMQRFFRQRAVRAVLKSIGYDGRVTALETTFGLGSGWHPHHHVALFVRGDTDPAQVHAQLAPLWSKAASAHGLTASLSHGLDIRGGECAGAYVSKLGLEVALSVRKLGRGDRFGLWQLLHASTENAWAAAAFSHAARTLKGKRHLVWSKGLRSILGLDAELTDEEIMQANGEKDELLFGWLTTQLWRSICRNSIRGEVLHAAGLGDESAVRDLLRSFGLDDFGLTTV